MSSFDSNDIRCVACGSEKIVPTDVSASLFHCTDCDYIYQSVWGVPFFGRYEEEDILGLIEISANVVNRGKFGVTPGVVEDWEQLLLAYDQATDKADFIKDNPNAQSPFLLNRYGEWVEIARLTQGLNLRGMKVLDMGAGLGFDSYRLTMLGATVTALEFSPVLAESGQLNFPHIRWVGGLSHYLPFKSASFDAVFCNAALHHMRDIPATISEALRVLRPGGVLITTCDSFRPSNSGDEAELDIFDREPAVLLGVNEGVPRFSDFVATFQKHPALLDVELYTHTLYDAPSGGTLSEFTRWNLDKDGTMLSLRSGSLAMRVRLKNAWTEPATIQTNAILAASEYVSWMSSASVALAKLAPLIPTQFLDLPFPGTTGSKFELLNGWRLTQPFRQARTAYQRGRWFLRRPAAHDTLVFELGLASSGMSTVDSISVLLNGEEASAHSVSHNNWKHVTLDISGMPVGQVFAVELQQQGGGASLDEASFVVRNRRFISTRQIADHEAIGNAHPVAATNVFAVIPVFNRLHFTRDCIRHLKAQIYQPIRIIVADGGSSDGTVEAIHDEHPDVVVLTSGTELWWAGSMAMGIDHALSESRSEEDFVLMMNNDTQIPNDYVEKLVFASKAYDAAVGALVVDSRDATRVLDAGEYIDWATYSFPVKSSVGVDECFCDDVDVLPGRGSLVPLRMIRVAGNVDARTWPHYLADYEFFYRLKQRGCRLGVSYETRILAHINETGIVPTNGKSGFRSIWREAFSPRSMSNVLDHWRFVGRHAPEQYRAAIRRRLIRRVVADFTLRTPARPIFLPAYWLVCLPLRILVVLQGQRRMFSLFLHAIRTHGIDVLCNPHDFPGLIRWPLYFVAAPGPISHTDLEQLDLTVEQLLELGVLRPLRVEGWYALETLNFSVHHRAPKLKRLFWSVWNPLRKVRNTLVWRRDLLKKA
jgi:GT2 family glycosyltransferase/SAM-dependent methyltransferase